MPPVLLECFRTFVSDAGQAKLVLAWPACQSPLVRLQMAAGDAAHAERLRNGQPAAAASAVALWWAALTAFKHRWAAPQSPFASGAAAYGRFGVLAEFGDACGAPWVVSHNFCQAAVQALLAGIKENVPDSQRWVPSPALAWRLIALIASAVCGKLARDACTALLNVPPCGNMWQTTHQPPLTGSGTAAVSQTGPPELHALHGPPCMCRRLDCLAVSYLEALQAPPPHAGPQTATGAGAGAGWPALLAYCSTLVELLEVPHLGDLILACGGGGFFCDAATRMLVRLARTAQHPRPVMCGSRVPLMPSPVVALLMSPYLLSSCTTVLLLLPCSASVQARGWMWMRTGPTIRWLPWPCCFGQRSPVQH